MEKDKYMKTLVKLDTGKDHLKNRLTSHRVTKAGCAAADTGLRKSVGLSLLDLKTVGLILLDLGKVLD